MTEAYDGRQVVGMDLHRRRSVLVRMTEDGRRLDTARITNSPAALRAEIAKAGISPRVVLEATYGWYWAADVMGHPQPHTLTAPAASFPVRDYRLADRRVKDTYSAANAAGLRPVHDPSARSHEHRHLSGKAAMRPARHALQ